MKCAKIFGQGPPPPHLDKIQKKQPLFFRDPLGPSHYITFCYWRYHRYASHSNTILFVKGDATKHFLSSIRDLLYFKANIGCWCGYDSLTHHPWNPAEPSFQQYSIESIFGRNENAKMNREKRNRIHQDCTFWHQWSRPSLNLVIFPFLHFFQKL